MAAPTVEAWRALRRVMRYVLGTTEWTLDVKHQVSEVLFVEGKASGLFQGWYVSGSKSVLGSFKLGQRDGDWTWWYENGQKQTEGAYYGKAKVGVWTDWWPTGQMKSTGTYASDIKVLLWQYWDTDGNSSTENYDQWGNKR